MQCLQYKTDQQSDVKKVEKLNNLFFGLMAKGVEEEHEGSVQLAPNNAVTLLETSECISSCLPKSSESNCKSSLH